MRDVICAQFANSKHQTRIHVFKLMMLGSFTETSIFKMYFRAYSYGDENRSLVSHNICSKSVIELVMLFSKLNFTVILYIMGNFKDKLKSHLSSRNTSAVTKKSLKITLLWE